MSWELVKFFARNWWVLLFVAAGLGLSTWILDSAWGNIEAVRHGVVVTGRIVDIKTTTITVRSNGGSKTRLHREPTIEYADASGTTHRFVPDVFSGVPVIGPIEVRYDNEHPERARLARWDHNWAFLLFWIPFAVVLIAGPVFLLRQEWKSRVTYSPATPPPADALAPKRLPGDAPPMPLDPKAVARSIERHRRKRGDAK